MNFYTEYGLRLDVLVELCAQQVVYELATLVLPGTHRLVLKYQVFTGVSSKITGHEEKVVTDHHPTYASRRMFPERWYSCRWNPGRGRRQD